MKYTVVLALVITLGYLPARAQSTEDSVKAAVNAVFIAMKSADPGQLRDAFADTAPPPAP